MQMKVFEGYEDYTFEQTVRSGNTPVSRTVRFSGKVKPILSLVVAKKSDNSDLVYVHQYDFPEKLRLAKPWETQSDVGELVVSDRILAVIHSGEGHVIPLKPELNDGLTCYSINVEYQAA